MHIKSYTSIIKEIFLNKFQPSLKVTPSFFTFHLTRSCNAKCVMCNIWKSSTKEKELSLLQIKEMFSGITNIDGIRLTGGEPFLRNDIAEIANFFLFQKKAGIVHITTNGLQTEKIVAAIKKIKPTKRLHLKVSLDGLENIHDEIRGIPGAYQQTLNTLLKLIELRKEKKFFLAINQTISNNQGLESFAKLTKQFQKFKLTILPVFAYHNDVLYQGGAARRSSPATDWFKPSKISESQLKEFFILVIKMIPKNNFKEILVKKYYIKGLRNRLLKTKSWPSPKCISLRNHIRILPNGDIPVCLYNSYIVGNLFKQSWSEIIKSSEYKNELSWLKKCSGCWAECETIPNAIYTGDIIKGLII